MFMKVSWSQWVLEGKENNGREAKEPWHKKDTSKHNSNGSVIKAHKVLLKASQLKFKIPLQCISHLYIQGYSFTEPKEQRNNVVQRCVCYLLPPLKRTILCNSFWNSFTFTLVCIILLAVSHLWKKHSCMCSEGPFSPCWPHLFYYNSQCKKWEVVAKVRFLHLVKCFKLLTRSVTNTDMFW